MAGGWWVAEGEGKGEGEEEGEGAGAREDRRVAVELGGAEEISFWVVFYYYCKIKTKNIKPHLLTPPSLLPPASSSLAPAASLP